MRKKTIIIILFLVFTKGASAVMHVDIEQIPTGPLETNTYVVHAGNKALIIDPSRGCADVIGYCEKKKLTVEAIILTHGHFDHIMGIPEIRKRYGMVDVWVHPDEKILLTNPDYNGSTMIGSAFTFTEPTKALAEGVQTIGSFQMMVKHVPGHSPGSCVLILDGQAIAGDVLFAGSVGRSDFPGGDGALLIRGIREKLLVLPAETVVWSGHGNKTTIGKEARFNQFLQ